jgi:hypothetical protein
MLGAFVELGKREMVERLQSASLHQTLQQVIAAADNRAESTAAFVKNMVERKMLGLPE